MVQPTITKSELRAKIVAKLRPFLADVTDKSVSYMTGKTGIRDTDQAINLAWTDVLKDIRKAWTQTRVKDWHIKDKQKTEEREMMVDMDEQPIATPLDDGDFELDNARHDGRLL